MSKTCSNCKKDKEYDKYYPDKGTKDKYSSVCITCQLEAHKLKQIELGKREIPADIHIGKKVCSGCKLEKEKSVFTQDIGRVDFLSSICKVCAKIENEKRYIKQREREIPDDVFDGTKKCPHCNKILDKSKFHLKRDTGDFLNSWCKKCRKEEHYETIRAYLKEKKIEMGGKCVKCQYSNIDVLQFDHYKGDKIAEVHSMQSIKKIDEEIKKCQLLCSICHHIKTAQEHKHKDFTNKNMTNKLNNIERNYEYVDYIKLKIGSCQMCKRNINSEIKEEFCAYHFDHIDENNKTANVSFLCKQGYSIDTIDKELAKCQLLCANCHMIRTIKQFNYYNYTNKDKKKRRG